MREKSVGGGKSGTPATTPKTPQPRPNPSNGGKGK